MLSEHLNLFYEPYPYDLWENMSLKAVTASGQCPKDATTVRRRIVVLWFGFYQGLSTVLEVHVADGHTAGDIWAGRVAQRVSHDLVSLHMGLSISLCPLVGSCLGNYMFKNTVYKLLSLFYSKGILLDLKRYM